LQAFHTHGRAASDGRPQPALGQKHLKLMSYGALRVGMRSSISPDCSFSPQEQTMETNTEPIGALAFARKKLAECERRIAQFER